MNRLHIIFSHINNLAIPRLIALTVVGLLWSGVALCQGIIDAAVKGDLETVKTLLKDNPALVSTKNYDGETALILAAISGNKDMVELLLDNKADVNAGDGHGRTPLAWAAEKDYRDMAELLISKGANVNAKDYQDVTPLHDAAHNGYLDIAELLLAKGGNVNARDVSGGTPLFDAVEYGYKDLAELLIAKGAYVNVRDNNGWSPLHWAAYKGKKEMAEFLLANKALVNARSKDGETPLDIALENPSSDVTELLRQHHGRELYKGSTNSVNAPSTARISNGVPAISISNGRAFIAGSISVGNNISTINNKLFTCNIVQPLKEGDKVPATSSGDQSWSIKTRTLQVGVKQISYPILAMVNTSNGVKILIPAVVKIKANIKPGETVGSEGYQIETNQAVKAGESISVLFIDNSLLSLQGVNGKPWFTAIKNGTSKSERAAMIEAWRLENKHAHR